MKHSLTLKFTTPDDEPEGPCEVCGLPVLKCKCPECPQCGNWGDPKCYENHGLKKPE